MTHTQLLFGDEARAKVLAGARTLADAVRLTLGPKAKGVLLGKKWGTPLVCDDGVTVAREVHLRDPVEDLGVQMLRQAAIRTGDAVGDGTTTATLLAYELFSEGVRNVVAGASAIELKRGFDAGAEAAIAALKKLAKPIETRAEKAQIATVSAHGESAVGELVAAAIERVGAEGVVSVEEAKGTETELDVVEGMRFDRGYLSPYFVTNPEKMQAELIEPMILLYDKRISSMAPLVPLLEAVARAGRQLVVIAEEIEGEALATLVINKLRGILPCAAIKAPGFGDRRKAMLEDLAILTGGEILAEELGSKLEQAQLSQLGSAKRVLIDRDSTTIIGGAGDKAALQGRCNELRGQIKETSSDYDREKLQERLAKLAGGVAVIRAGAPTEAEMKKRKEAFEDAINATQAAVAEGIIPGGGVALIRAIAAVRAIEPQQQGDRLTGLRALERAMEVPLRQIAHNAQIDPGVAVERVVAGSGAFGLDATSGRYDDLIKLGIIDPVKVVRTALENAASIAGTLLLADATLTEVEEPADKKPGASVDDLG
jgi:chaperonin GroEL